MARGAGYTRVIQMVSSNASLSYSQIAAARMHPTQVLFFQLYKNRDDTRAEERLREIERLGYKAVFLTVDTPILGRRNLEIRNQFKLPAHLKIANFTQDEESSPDQKDNEANTSKKRDNKPTPSKPGYTDGSRRNPPTGPITFHSHAANPTLSWENTVDWLKKECGPEMQVWVKGIATAEIGRAHV